MNDSYTQKAIDGELQKLRDAGPGTTNDVLIAVACRLFEFVNASAISEIDAVQRLTDIARSKGHADQSIADTLKSAQRRVAGKAASIPTPAQATRDPEPVYADLADYERQRGVPAGTYAAAGWKDTTHHGRCAVELMTEAGPRWRYLDGNTPKYWHAPGTHTDQTKRWYKLGVALAIATTTPQPLVLCNGESSVVAAQAHDVAATCITGGGERTLPQPLLDELLATWPGDFVIALDCDDKGRKAAPALAQQLIDAGRNARAVDLKLGHKQDLADFCAWHNSHSVVDLATLDDLPAVAPTAPTATPAAARFTIRTEADFAALPPVKYLSRHLGIVSGAFHLTYGASGSGKTFFEVENTMHLATQGYTVVYVATEDVSGLRYRVAAWRLANPGKAGNLHWLEMPLGLDLADTTQVDALIAALKPLQPDYIPIDTLREAHTGDENSSQDGAKINQAIQRIMRETGAAVDLVHHTGVAGERPRGTTALFANCDVVRKVENDDGTVRVYFEKTRGLHGPLRDPLAFAFVSQESGLTDSDGQMVVSAVLRAGTASPSATSPTLTPNQRKILEALNLSVFATSGARVTQIVHITQLNERMIYRDLSALKNRGHISHASKGHPYFITRDGQCALDPVYVLVPDNDATAPQSPTDTTDNDLTTAEPMTVDPAPDLTDSDNTRSVVSAVRSDSQDMAARKAKEKADKQARGDAIHNKHTAEQVQCHINTKRWDKALEAAGTARGQPTQRTLAQMVKDAQQGDSGSIGRSLEGYE